ncbi:MAG: YfiR family protein [Caulobacteraceae bacterium]
MGRRRTPSSLRAAAAAAAVMAYGVACGPAWAESSAEQATKAAVIYNFSRFADWPEDRFSGPSDPVVLCVPPAAPLSEELLRLNGAPVKTRKLAVRVTTRFDRSCHMAYVDGHWSASSLGDLKSKGVLTVGEGDGFIALGSIQMLTIGRQVRFAVNQKNALAAGATLSSNLLRLAVAVR